MIFQKGPKLLTDFQKLIPGPIERWKIDCERKGEIKAHYWPDHEGRLAVQELVHLNDRWVILK